MHDLWSESDNLKKKLVSSKPNKRKYVILAVKYHLPYKMESPKKRRDFLLDEYNNSDIIHF